MTERPTAQSRRINKALAKLSPKIRKAFLRVIERAINDIDVDRLVAAIAAGDIEQAVAVARLDASSFFDLDEEIRTAYVAGGAMAGQEIPRGLSARWAFNGRHARAETWMLQHGAELIQSITEETTEVTRRVVTRGLQQGRSHRAIAREITGKVVKGQRTGGYLGLTTQQQEQIENAREILSDPDRIREYFVRDRKTGRMKPRYKLSDRRFDNAVRAAIKDGKAIKGKALDKMLEAHRSKALGYRGRLIAKDQAHTALASGRDEAYRQIEERPDVEYVTVRWQHNLSLDDRDDHVAMSGTVIRLGETFNFPDGTRMKYPHDPVGGPKHNAHCRCTAHCRVRLRR